MAEPRFRAIRTCYHRNYLYNPGDLYKPSPEELSEKDPTQIPEHFVRERDFSEELVEVADMEDRNRKVFVKPTKADEVQSPADAKK